ncbi:hypothetical protein [Haloarcula litorea]|uniref:hypothetical protein n=1 Tax=Haloarcula litorea TaxID=3032579 RepID=UPI0023E76BCC|nr:hypothetical protein [Halomicroarcula sp. GDY20]
MSTRSSRTGASDAQQRDRSALPASFSRYDLVLALIPAAFLLAMGVGGLFGFSVRTALTLGALLGTCAVVDALFLNPPRGGGPA